MQIPLVLKTNVINSLGKRGEMWIDSLVLILSQLIDKWKLIKVKPVDNISYNYVCTAYSQLYHKGAVLKISPFKEDLQYEIKAITAYQNRACAQFIDYDMAYGAILLERLIPATSLKSFFPAKEQESITIAAQVMQNLHTAKLDNQTNFQNIEVWLAAFNKPSCFARQHITKAGNIASSLPKDRLVLLHGDLHHDNILLNGKEWVAIDPKGVVGHSNYEIGAFIYNPIPELLATNNPQGTIATRIALFSKLLNAEVSQIKDFAYVMAVLSAVWFSEGEGDKQGMDYMLKVIELIESV
jgi:streptomycin 6-kinase